MKICDDYDERNADEWESYGRKSDENAEKIARKGVIEGRKGFPWFYASCIGAQ